MPEATPAQRQILEEMAALVKAWEDRGTQYKDVVPLFATYFAATAVQAGYSFEKMSEMFGRLWAATMHKVVEAQIAKGIPNPPSKP